MSRPPQLLRKLFHLSSIVIPIIYLFTNRQVTLTLTAAGFIIDCIIEYLRISGRLRVAFIEKYTKLSESKRPTGSFFYFLAALITILLFPKHAAVASLCILSISDPLSSIVGSTLGKIRLMEKTLEGSITFFLSSLVILVFFQFPFTVSLVSALIASLTELFSVGFIDDNLSIPILTALTITISTSFII